MSILNESPDEINSKVLFNLLKEYDTYIQSAVKKECHKNGWEPLSVDEFYDTEFNIINVRNKTLLENKQEQKKREDSWSTLNKNNLKTKKKPWWLRWLP